MNIFNKFEAIGIFLSVAVMAVALSLIRFKTDILVANPSLEGETQSAVVAVSGRNENEMREALVAAADPEGEIVKLVVDDVVVGGGKEAKVGDTVVVHYVATTQDGVKFDSSYDRGEPFSFTLGEGKVIQGWEKGILGMRVGGDRILVVPPSMAYGNNQVGPIPPNSTLVFAVELLSIE